jgi:hypothetical protein
VNRTLFNLEITLRAATHRSAAPSQRGCTDLFLCLVDHYEPQVGRAARPLARERVEDWLRRYPLVAGRHRDADGRVPPHGFFYPWDEYDPWELDRIAELCALGYGEIDLHLHHSGDTEASLRARLDEGIAAFRKHGAFSRWADGRPAWGFIHGNWALDNSRFDQDHCGVNSEISLLQELGCYADFTFPAWKHTAQPRLVNSLHYAVDDPALPKSHDQGEAARVGNTAASGLLLVQGPLVPYLDRRGTLPRPAMDDSDLAASRRYEPERLDRWVRAGIHVQGRPDRVFIKLHTHGAPEANREALLGSDLEALFSDAEARYNDGERYRLHYVTAREMFNIIKATEAGAPAPIAELRDWLLPRPGVSVSARLSPTGA